MLTLIRSTKRREGPQSCLRSSRSRMLVAYLGARCVPGHLHNAHLLIRVHVRMLQFLSSYYEHLLLYARVSRSTADHSEGDADDVTVDGEEGG